MIRQFFDVDDYWKVIVYYGVDYNLFYIIEKDLLSSGISKETLDELYDVMSSGKAKAVTFSNTSSKVSIVLFNKHSSNEDYLNSIVHEAEHVKQAMLYRYGVEDKDEPPAYTIGYLVMMMYKVWVKIKETSRLPL